MAILEVTYLFVDPLEGDELVRQTDNVRSDHIKEFECEAKERYGDSYKRLSVVQHNNEDVLDSCLGSGYNISILRKNISQHDPELMKQKQEIEEDLSTLQAFKAKMAYEKSFVGVAYANGLCHQLKQNIPLSNEQRESFDRKLADIDIVGVSNFILSQVDGRSKATNKSDVGGYEVGQTPDMVKASIMDTFHVKYKKGKHLDTHAAFYSGGNTIYKRKLCIPNVIQFVCFCEKIGVTIHKLTKLSDETEVNVSAIIKAYREGIHDDKRKKGRA
jgi:hypothetical protein